LNFQNVRRNEEAKRVELEDLFLIFPLFYEITFSPDLNQETFD